MSPGNANSQVKVLKKWTNPASFSFIFGLFKQTIQFLTTNQSEKMSIQYTAKGFEPTTS